MPAQDVLAEAKSGGNWTDRYIGVPFKAGGRDFSGCDCGGLVLLVLKEEKGVMASDFNAYAAADFKDCRAGFERLGAVVDSLMDEWIVVERPQPFDLVRFRYGRHPVHVGLYTGQGKFLHVDESALFACIRPLNSAEWVNRFMEFRRHRSLYEAEKV